jgi:hypothetical protein
MRCALQYECIFVRRLADAVENPFEGVFGQKQIEVFFLSPGSIEKTLLHGCGGVGVAWETSPDYPLTNSWEDIVRATSFLSSAASTRDNRQPC